MLRLAIVLVLSFCFRCSFAENVGEILDPNTPARAPVPDSKTAPEKKDPAPATSPGGAVDEPGFKASVKFGSSPAPKYDLSTKGGNQIPVPKTGSVWTVPLEDGYSAPANPAANAPATPDEKTPATVENISPQLASVIAREKGGAKLKDIIPAYQAIVNSDKENAAAHYRLGLAQIRGGDLQSGVNELETTIRLQPSNPKYLCDYAVAALRAGWVEKSFAACQAAIAAAPKNPRYHSALGDVHLAADHIPDAIEAYTRAVKLEPDNPGYIYNLGLAYMRGKDFKRSLDLFNEAIRLKPQSPQYYCSRGLAYENSKNIRGAMEDYGAAIKLDKNFPYAHYLIAGVFSDPIDPTYTDPLEAVEHADKAVKLTNFKNAEYLIGLARALRVARKYDQAAIAAKKAVELEPARSDYRQLLAEYEDLKMKGSVK